MRTTKGFIFEKLYIHGRRPFHVYTGLEKETRFVFQQRCSRHKSGITNTKILWDRAIPKVCFCKEIFPIELRDTRKITRLGVPLRVEVVAVS